MSTHVTFKVINDHRFYTDHPYPTNSQIYCFVFAPKSVFFHITVKHENNASMKQMGPLRPFCRSH